MTGDRPPAPAVDVPATGPLELVALLCLAAGPLGLVVPGLAGAATVLLPPVGLLAVWLSDRWGPWSKAGVTALVLAPLVLGAHVVLAMLAPDLAAVLANPLGVDLLPVAPAMLVVVPGTVVAGLVAVCWLALLLRWRPRPTAS